MLPSVVTFFMLMTYFPQKSSHDDFHVLGSVALIEIKLPTLLPSLHKNLHNVVTYDSHELS